MTDELTIHCLECDNTYPELASVTLNTTTMTTIVDTRCQEPVVKVCPYCGNDNMELTVYLQGDDDEEIDNG